jgi:hypothetical protein
VQFVSARDVHDVKWTFRHIYQGTQRQHQLTTGWSNFVNNKKLLPGEDGKVHIGLRHAKRVFYGEDGDGFASLVWGNPGSPCAASSPSDGKVVAEDVVAAARLATKHPFKVVH